DPIAWAAAGLAWGLNRINALAPTYPRARELGVELEKHFQTTVRMLRSFHPHSRNVPDAPLGAWNMYFNQKDPNQHSNYTTILVLQSVLETHLSSLNWRLEGGEGMNSKLIGAICDILISRIRSALPVAGWVAELTESDSPSCDEGLTLQAYYLL